MSLLSCVILRDHTASHLIAWSHDLKKYEFFSKRDLIFNVNVKKTTIDICVRKRCAWNVVKVSHGCVAWAVISPEWLLITFCAFISAGEGGRWTTDRTKNDKKTTEEQRRSEEEPPKTNRESWWTSWGLNHSLLVRQNWFPSCLLQSSLSKFPSPSQSHPAAHRLCYSAVCIV